MLKGARAGAGEGLDSLFYKVQQVHLYYSSLRRDRTLRLYIDYRALNKITIEIVTHLLLIRP